MPCFKLSDTNLGIVDVTTNDQAAGFLRVEIVRPGNNQFFSPQTCSVARVWENDSRVRIEFHHPGEKIVVALELQPHPVGFTGRFSARGDGHAIVRLVWVLPDDERGFPFVPAFMYGRNEGGNSPWATYPQLRSGSIPDPIRPWVADEWLVRADRSSHGVTSVITDGFTYALGGRDVCRFPDGMVAEKNGLGISSADPHRLSFSLGFANVPFTYSDLPGRNYISRPEGFVSFDRGEASADFFLFLFPSLSRTDAASRLLRESYGILHDRIPDAGTVEEAVGAIAETLVQYGYSREARNFFVTFSEDSQPISLEDNFCSAWAGGLRTAYPLLMAGYQFNNSRWKECARSVFSNLATNAISKASGLFYENYCLSRHEWNTRGWWYQALEKPGHSGYVNGQICHYLLLGYQVEKNAGVEQAAWLDAARRVLDHVATEQSPDGRFGYSYRETDGAILDHDGFSSCWFTPAFATLYHLTEEKRYLDAACRAMDFYRKAVETFHVYGGPHDTYKSPDEEGILAWIEAARLLHQITGDEQYLRDLIHGLDYEFSWKFAYNVVNEVEPLKSMNWSSTGGSVTSVNNSHIHPMGSAISTSLLYATNRTGDPYLRSRLIDTVRWTLTVYLHHDGQYGWGKKGMINERFCYTDSLLIERYPDGLPASTWFCAHSWASGAVLEGLVGPILDAARTNPSAVLGPKTA
ncbi:MAG: hypothetical protein WC975_12400 [Phycisphaerae bacterium]